MPKWESMLAKLSFQASFMQSSGMKASKGYLYDTPIDYVNGVMQDAMPGGYIVEEYYDKKKMMFQYRLKFNTPADETFWMIQNV